MIDIVRGDTNDLVFAIREAYDANGNLITNLSGYSALLQARYTPNDPTPLFQRPGMIYGTNVIVRLQPSDTADLSGGERLVADLQLSDGAGHVVTVDVGEQPLILRVLPDVTR